MSINDINGLHNKYGLPIELAQQPQTIKGFLKGDKKQKTKIAVNEIVFYPLYKLSDMIKYQIITSKELVSFFYHHISTYNKEIRCIVGLTPIDELLREAEIADQELKNGLYRGPLHGIPMTVKDTFNVKGLRTYNGYPPLRNYVPLHDAYQVTQLREAGAIIIGKTNFTLYGIDWISDYFWFGRTYNPYDTKRVPGGSSGGAAAALASGFTPIELGSDAGGSIRAPSHFCGTYGFRPTDGLLSKDDTMQLPGTLKSLPKIAVPGPMARNVKDLRILFDILYPAGALVKNAAGTSQQQDDEHISLNIAYSNTLNDMEVDRDYKSIFASFLEKLKQQGHIVTEAQPQFDHQKSYVNYAVMMGVDFDINMPGIVLEKYIFKFFLHLKYWGPLWSKGMLKGMSGNKKEYLKAIEYKDEVSQDFDNFLTIYDIWLTPVALDCAFEHQRLFDPFIINNKKANYEEAIATFNFTTAFPGHPICVIPIGFIKTGLPVGIQIHGKRFNDRRLLQISEILEKLTPGFRIPDMYTSEGE